MTSENVIRTLEKVMNTEHKKKEKNCVSHEPIFTSLHIIAVALFFIRFLDSEFSF